MATKPKHPKMFVSRLLIQPAFDRPEQELVYSGWGRLNFFIPIILLPLSNDSAAASLHSDFLHEQEHGIFGGPERT